jgi:hypothetical protein
MAAAINRKFFEKRIEETTWSLPEDMFIPKTLAIDMLYHIQSLENHIADLHNTINRISQVDSHSKSIQADLMRYAHKLDKIQAILKE